MDRALKEISPSSCSNHLSSAILVRVSSRSFRENLTGTKSERNECEKVDLFARLSHTINLTHTFTHTRYHKHTIAHSLTHYHTHNSITHTQSYSLKSKHTTTHLLRQTQSWALAMRWRCRIPKWRSPLRSSYRVQVGRECSKATACSTDAPSDSPTRNNSFHSLRRCISWSGEKRKKVQKRYMVSDSLCLTSFINVDLK